MYRNFKSQLGYENGENKIDSYGVDHSNFSLRDEVSYQMARTNRENELIKNYNNQGITQDYPQYNTNFWGNNPANNYGFGSSNISDNIENVTNSLKNQNYGFDTNTNNLKSNDVYNTVGNNGTFNTANIQTPPQTLNQLQSNSLNKANSMELFNNTPSLQMDLSLKPLNKSNSYTTESAWGFPNTKQTPFYEKMEQPYNNDNTTYARTNTTQNIPEYTLGLLSRLSESNNGKKLWNNGEKDKTGGWSYGLYQIATKTGTMNDYLNYILKNPSYFSFYNTLQQAGGNEAALIGNEQFKKAWAHLSQNKNFIQSQQDFIINKKLKPALHYIKDIKGLDFDKRSPVIRDVLFSTAVQHGEGGASTIFHNALGNDASLLSNEDIINLIYNERYNVKRYFSKSTPEVQDSIKQRFLDECKKAQELLKNYP